MFRPCALGLALAVLLAGASYGEDDVALVTVYATKPRIGSWLASLECAGRTIVIGTGGAVTLRLPPGRHKLVARLTSSAGWRPKPAKLELELQAGQHFYFQLRDRGGIPPKMRLDARRPDEAERKIAQGVPPSVIDLVQAVTAELDERTIETAATEGDTPEVRAAATARVTDAEVGDAAAARQDQLGAREAERRSECGENAELAVSECSLDASGGSDSCRRALDGLLTCPSNETQGTFVQLAGVAGTESLRLWAAGRIGDEKLAGNALAALAESPKSPYVRAVLEARDTKRCRKDAAQVLEGMRHDAPFTMLDDAGQGLLKCLWKARNPLVVRLKPAGVGVQWRQVDSQPVSQSGELFVPAGPERHTAVVGMSTTWVETVGNYQTTKQQTWDHLGLSFAATPGAACWVEIKKGGVGAVSCRPRKSWE